MDHLIISACHVNAIVKLAILVPNALHRLKKRLLGTVRTMDPVTIKGFLSRDVDARDFLLLNDTLCQALCRIADNL